jgi:hypothetical protein
MVRFLAFGTKRRQPCESSKRAAPDPCRLESSLPSAWCGAQTLRRPSGRLNSGSWCRMWPMLVPWSRRRRRSFPIGPSRMVPSAWR